MTRQTTSNEAYNAAWDEAISHDLTLTYPGVERFPAAALLRAIELGGSDELVGSASVHYLDYEKRGGGDWRTAVRLSYVHELLASGHSRDQVRDLFERLAFQDSGQGSCYGHREAFWLDHEAAAALYGDSPELLHDFAKKIAEDHAEELLRHHDVLAARLGRRELVTEVLQAATWRLQMIGSEAEFQLIRSLPIPDQIRAAVRTNCIHPWNLVLKGFVLARYTIRDRRDLQHLRGELRQTISERRPEYAPASWRWFAEGFRRGFKPSHGVTWRYALDSMLKTDPHGSAWGLEGFDGLFEQAGCQFLQVRPIPRPGGSVLQVSVRTPQGSIVLRHQSDGPRGEQLKPGDLVVVSAAQVAKRQPNFREGGRPGFNLELHKADVPTPAMFTDPALGFRR